MWRHNPDGHNEQWFLNYSALFILIMMKSNYQFYMIIASDNGRILLLPVVLPSV